MSTPNVVVVTGASAGVGRAAARAFAERGASVALLARGVDGLAGARRDVEDLGGRAYVASLDISDAASVEAAASSVEENLGPIDVWVNNAMASVVAPLTETAAADYRRVTEVTYLGSVYGTMSALRRMVPRDHGIIVQVGSALAYRGIPLQAAYCGAKHALQGFTESVRCELMHDRSNVRITMVQLPALNTPQFKWAKTTLPWHPRPVAPVYQPELAARAILWAAEHPRRELWVGASTMATILGDKLLPGALDRYLAETAYRAQQADWPIESDRVDNLWMPVAGDAGAHGAFDERAHERSFQWWASRNRWWLGAAAGAVSAAVWGRKRPAKLAGRR
jgi:NAD(P)-dependent dehydrogenase (short-subunit alcohol dehydrogenase family)